MATQTQARTPPVQSSQTDLGDFFDNVAPTVREIRALGADFWEMDSGTICKLYEASRAPDSDANRMGIIPVTYSVDHRLLPRLKEVKTWPCVLHAEVVTIAGSKNKSTNLIVSISGIGV